MFAFCGPAVEEGGCELQGLPRRYVLVEARILGQVADAPANLHALPDDVVAEHCAAAGSGPGQAEKQLMVVVLPAPLGPRKPKMECWRTCRSRDLRAATPL